MAPMNLIVNSFYRSVANLTLSLLATGLTVSCAVSGDRQEPVIQEHVASTPAVEAAEEQREQQVLTDDLMYDLLLAEIAGQRGAFDVSVERYLEAAMVARDPRVAQRAVQMATYAQQYDVALLAARRWVELVPDSEDAHKSIVALALQQGDLNTVVRHLDALIRISGNPEEGFRTATAVLARHADRQAALDSIGQLVERHLQDPYAWMARSRMAVLAERLDIALESVDRALGIDPDLAAAMILKAQVLVRMKRKDDARQLLGAAASRHPDEPDLVFAYGRMLLDAEDLMGAHAQFARVVELDPEYPGGLYSLALLELETRQFKAGEKHLKQLLKQNRDDQNALYYLGYAAHEQGDAAAALDWYLKVESGDYWSQALVRATRIMAENGDIKRMQDHMRIMRQKHPDQAVEFYLIEGQVLTDIDQHQAAYSVYDAALEFNPDHPDLLYAHALAAEQLDKLAVAEADMRRILEQDPDDVRTLNALGYTLADRTDRYEEALTYISRAFMHKPDDPAIIDSMGWVYFRLGDLEKARFYLQQAWENSQDSEIGAHYGEVLWVSGERDEARRIWAESRKISPDDPVLLDVIHRLDP